MVDHGTVHSSASALEVLFSCNSKIYCKYLLPDDFASSCGNDVKVIVLCYANYRAANWSLKSPKVPFYTIGP